MRPGATGGPSILGQLGPGLYYTQMPPIEMPEMPPQAHTTPLQMQHQIGLHQINIYGQPPITDAQVAQARLYKQGHRPLGRTQSAPLPLGHPMLTGAAGVPQPPHYENAETAAGATDGIDLSTGDGGGGSGGSQQHLHKSIFQTDRSYDQRHLLQKIRQTVLTRSARDSQSLKEEETAEVNMIVWGKLLEMKSLLIKILLFEF